MRHILAFIAALFSISSLAQSPPPPQPLPWAAATELYITTSQARLYYMNIVYVMTHTGQPCIGQCAEGVWHAVDLKPYGVSADAVAAQLSGMLIITHGTTPEVADIQVTFRKQGDTTADCGKYLGQTVEGNIGGGQRSNFTTWVPLNNGVFEWCFTVSTSGNWPTNSAYGVNMSLQAYVR